MKPNRSVSGIFLGFLLDPVPRGGKRPLVPQEAGFQVCRAKVLAQGASTNPMVLRHRATNPASLKIQLDSHIGKSRIRDVRISVSFSQGSGYGKSLGQNGRKRP